MDPITAPEFAGALAALAPADRALLELTYRRGMGVEEVAAVLGSPQTAVVDQRDAALATLADLLGEQRGDPALERALADAGEAPWRAPAGEGAGTDDDDQGNGEPEASASPSPPRRLGSLRRRLILLGIAALLLGIAAGILIATADDSDDGAGGAERRSQAAADARARAPRPPRELGPLVELTPEVEGVEGAVSARLIRSRRRVRLALRARDLTTPRGHYEVWLLDAPKRALSLARFKTRDFELNAPLPPDFGSYQQLDISMELEDGNEDHSGASAFMTELSNLAIR